MAFVFNFPDVGEGIHEGRVVEWLVAEGDEVAEDQALLKVETDKAVVELPSPKAGTVLRLHAEADAAIEVGQPLVTIAQEGEEVPAEVAEEVPGEDRPGAPPVSEEPEAPARSTETTSASAPARSRPLATPRTRAMARRLGVDLAALRGTGTGGRITDEDVERAAAGERPSEAAPAAERPAPAPGRAAAAEETAEGQVERVSLSHLRTVISRAMHASKHTAAHVTHVDEADVTELVTLQRSIRGRIEEESGVRVTLLPFFIRALVAILKKYPQFNASVDEERGEMLLKHFYNIGIAVDTPEGLIVPVVRNADRKDIVTLAGEVADMAERARSRALSLDELKGGTCTITNIGPLGGVFATPIINQPELAIVGLHKIADRPVVVDGEIVVRKTMYLSISFDHRWIDGADAARFMTDLARLVSDPKLLMVQL